MNRRILVAVTATAFVAIFNLTSAQAEERFDPKAMVSPTAQYSYAETAACLSSIKMADNAVQIGGTNRMTALLGRLPACEIEKIILAGNNKPLKKRIKANIEYRISSDGLKDR